jgi:hypothetical protein
MDSYQIAKEQPDKRTQPRFVPQDLWVLTLRDQELLPAYGVVNNISELGASLANDYVLPAGRNVRLKIRFNQSGDDFETEARIVWSQEGCDSSNGVAGFAFHGVEFTGLSDAQRAELKKILELSETLDAEPDAGRHVSRRQLIAISVLALLLAGAVGVASMAFQRLNTINGRLESTMARMERQTQQLHSGLHFDERRQHLLLGIRDEIVRTNRRITLSDAYEYAQLVLRASEKYPSIDPLLFLAVGIVESAYNPAATSHASAAGLYQIQPATGRLLARTLSWEYTENMLYDPATNTELAALYLDILLSTHDKVEVALAEYNGGPRNARYFQVGSHRLAEETRNYVPKVMGVYERLQNRFEAESQLRQATFTPAVSKGGAPGVGAP